MRLQAFNRKGKSEIRRVVQICQWYVKHVCIKYQTVIDYTLTGSMFHASAGREVLMLRPTMCLR